MKLGMKIGWMAAGILLVSTILTPSSVSAGFVTIDDFSKVDGEYEPVEEMGGERSSSGITFSSDDGLTASGSGGGLGASLSYFDIKPNGLRNILLKDVTSGESSGEVNIAAYFYFGLGEDDYTVHSRNGETDDKPRDLQFSYTGDHEVTDFEVLFTSDQPFELTSTSLQADFGSAQAVPEPTSLVLFGLASAGGGIAAWRKRRKQLTVTPASGTSV